MTKKSTLEKLDTRLAVLARIASNVKLLAVLVIGLGAAAGFLLSEGGRALACRYYLEATGARAASWQPLGDAFAHSFIALEGVLEGSPAAMPDRSLVQRLVVSPASVQYRWRDGETIRLYDVTQGAGGVWTVNERPAREPGWCEAPIGAG
jgi:hypothetical protein